MPFAVICGKSAVLHRHRMPDGKDKHMTILVIDGQGGKLGRSLVENIRREFPEVDLVAVGTNSMATAAMMKGGAVRAATGENPVVVACRSADIIVGPLGIAIADSLMGEVTPAMAVAVGQADAIRVLIPMNRCENLVAGVSSTSTTALIQDAVSKIAQHIAQNQ